MLCHWCSNPWEVSLWSVLTIPSLLLELSKRFDIPSIICFSICFILYSPRL